MAEGEKILKVHIEEEMKSAYIDYSMSVIVSRALPDVRDGLKPVHRRVLYGMRELGVYSNRPYKKSARIVGEVLGKYHPHGDSSVYFSMVRMAQHWSLRYRMVDGQGNFGSIDGDNPAAMRYTEARLRRIAEETMRDIEKETVDMNLNFDDTLEEPSVLPTRVPFLLINGASGIAVGMATNMPPHNLSNTIDATVAYIDNSEIPLEDLIKHIKAPDFPTGATIYGYDGVKKAYETGRGRIVVRAKSNIETNASGREKIIVTEIPYMVNKAELIQKVGDLVNEKKITGIVHANDESDREGMRIVFALRKDAIANVVLNQLYKYTALQTTFSVNNIALVNGRPKLLNLRDLIHYFVEHRHDVVYRRTRFDLRKAKERAHILEGLIIAVDNIDEVVRMIRASKNPDEARQSLMERFELSEIQAREILNMRLQRLTGLERDKLRSEYEEILKQIEYLEELLENKEMRMQVIKEELLEIREKYGDERRTDIVYASEEFNPEDFYANEAMVVTISHLGYIKRMRLSDFRTQRRGGKGARASNTRDEDFLEHLFSASMHNTMLFFTEKGKCFWLKVYEIPEGSKISKGRAMQNLLNIEPDDSVKAYINVEKLDDEEFVKKNYIVMATKHGVIKKTSLEAYSRPRTNGINAISIREGDSLLEAKLTNGENNIILGAKSGKAIRFPEEKVRAMGRTASGVRGIKLSDNDEVVGMICIENGSEDVLVVSENGYGKRSSIEDYRTTNRGGVGVKTMNVTEKTGELIAIKAVSDEHDIMIINRFGITIRLAVSNLRVIGRATQGVRLIDLADDDQIAAVARVPKSEDEDEDETNANGQNAEDSENTADSENAENSENVEPSENQETIDTLDSEDADETEKNETPEE